MQHFKSYLMELYWNFNRLSQYTNISLKWSPEFAIFCTSQSLSQKLLVKWAQQVLAQEIHGKCIEILLWNWSKVYIFCLIIYSHGLLPAIVSLLIDLISSLEMLEGFVTYALWSLLVCIMLIKYMYLYKAQKKTRSHITRVKLHSWQPYWF